MTGSRPQVDYLLRWTLNHNLNLLVHFHNDFNTLLREKYQATDDRVLRADIELYDTMNSANCFLMAFSYLEEMLRIIWGLHFRREDPPAGRSITRYKDRLLRQALNLDLGVSPAWALLQDAAMIRHCLLHANGAISLMRSPAPKNIRASIKRRDGLEESSGRVKVTRTFLKQCVIAIQDLRDEMLAASEAVDPRGAKGGTR